MDMELRASDELRKWEKPYVFQPYPKMLYRGLAAAPGWDHCTVQNAQEEEQKRDSGEGWRETLAEALAVQEKLSADIGTAAAERAAADRKLSAKAQAEATKAEDANDGQHLAEVPVTPIKKNGKPRKVLADGEK